MSSPYRTLAPNAPRPWRPLELGEGVRVSERARKLHYDCWATTPVTQDEYRPYVPLPDVVGYVTYIDDNPHIRIVHILWPGDNPMTTRWDDESLDPISGR